MVEETLSISGLRAPVTIYRDSYGVAHVRAANEHDAWFGQGLAAAHDRLWQMEYDRRRAAGRWAEVVGRSGVAGDTLARRLQLERAARDDVEAMSAQTRAMFEAYAAGVNAFIGSERPLPLEYALVGLAPERWEPWHSVASFKVRHVLMGVWQKKLAQAQLLARVGPDTYARLDGRPPAGSPVILPPGAPYRRLLDEAIDDIRQAAAHLGFLAEAEAGSNSWAVHGSRTTTGTPVLCNDSHRALDVPNVYWQVHVACPAFDVIGATFPGVPGFPHFGHNGSVAWSITHTGADYQDLYIEAFDPEHPGRYRTPDGWAGAERTVERIEVAGGAPVEIEVWRTRDGPIVHGDPRRGMALALRYTATDEPCRGFEALRPMLLAKTVAELHETQRPWVDPVNNLVSADTSGNIGYLTRGFLPLRSPATSRAHRQFPAPGWTGECRWIGRVPFEQLPQAINPPEGSIVTANQAVVSGDEPYIADSFSPPSRAERIVELLSANGRMTPAQIIAMQGDTTSRPAQTWVRLLGRSGPFDGDAERARSLLAGWDGNVLPESGPALLYGYFRRALARALFEPIVGADTWRWLTSGESPATHALVSRWMANAVAAVERDQASERRAEGEATPRHGDAETLGEGAPTAPAGPPRVRVREDAVMRALEEGWQQAAVRFGADPARWTWAAAHATDARHTLAARSPERAARFDPPRVGMGGDGDTIQAASYLWGERPEFPITGLSVYRQAVDLGDVACSSYVVPGGVSGEPGTSHFTDQLERWRTHQRIPMHYGEVDVRAAAVRALELKPA
ncbi:MAG: penicillin acylase family protein [Chloroflexi bacterium]|nr:penicillin acylase family protein [Chloroflexota bacterium]